MFKKTKVRQILELLNKNLSAREIARVLSVSRNSVASDAGAILGIASVHGGKCLEAACQKALKDFHLVTYKTLMDYIKKESRDSSNDTETADKRAGKPSAKGMVRGADYYRKDGK